MEQQPVAPELLQMLLEAREQLDSEHYPILAGYMDVMSVKFQQAIEDDRPLDLTDFALTVLSTLAGLEDRLNQLEARLK